MSVTLPVFFVSYSRADTDYEPYHQEMKRFVQDLSAKVAQKLGTNRDGICFFDESSIDTGTIWTTELAHALKSIRVGVVLYSPSYFTSKWCGKEFSVFLQRIPAPRAAGISSGIVPVSWVRCTTVPTCVAAIQNRHDAFPREYVEAGLQQLLTLKVYADQYQLTLEAIANGIVTAARSGLTPLATLDINAVESAWDTESARDPASHREGSIAKTCFVYAAHQGWGWRPYQDKKAIGAMAQRISGDLGLRYEEIGFDSQLTQKLRETRTSNVPTILFGDPESLLDSDYAKPFREYDDLYLLNCGALIPWDESSRSRGDDDEAWLNLRENVCQQKTKIPPPNHEWRSIFSEEDLESRTRTTIEDLRLRLLQQILSEDKPGTEAANGWVGSGNILKAENAELTRSAASQGIRVESAPQIEGPAK
jgi:hypothetical protein